MPKRQTHRHTNDQIEYTVWFVFFKLEEWANNTTMFTDQAVEIQNVWSIYCTSLYMFIHDDISRGLLNFFFI